MSNGLAVAPHPCVSGEKFRRIFLYTGFNTTCVESSIFEFLNRPQSMKEKQAKFKIAPINRYLEMLEIRH